MKGMAIFGLGKKNTDSLKTLTEKEIQSKLYGHIRPLKGLASSSAATSLKSPKTSSVPSTPVSTISSPLSFTSPSTDFDSPKVTHSYGDLFKVQETKVVSNKVGQDTALSAAEPALPRDKQIFPESSTAQKKGVSSSSILVGITTLISGVTPILRAILGKVLDAIAFLMTALIRFILAFDFRRPQFIRFISWAIGVVVLLGIFLGIHFLNLRREDAMKNPAAKPIKKVITSKVPATSAHKDKQKLSINALTSSDESVLSSKDEAVSSDTSVGLIPDSENKTSVEANSAAPTSNISTLSAKEAPFVIQIATFATQPDAVRVLDKIKTAGFDGFVKPLTRSGGKTYFCIFLGRFRVREKAESTLLSFKKNQASKPFQDAFVRSLSD